MQPAMSPDAAAPVLRDVDSWPFNWIGDLLRVIYACRVAAISVLLGYLLLTKVPQARDLFLVFQGPAFGPGTDYPRFWEMLFRWLVYFVIHIIAWSGAVQASAEHLLGESAWLIGPSRELTPRDMAIYDRRFRAFVLVVPYALALLTFFAVWRGYEAALADLPRDGVGSLALSAGILRSGSAGFYVALACGIAAHLFLWGRNIRDIAKTKAHFREKKRADSEGGSNWRAAVSLHASVWLALGLLMLGAVAAFGDRLLAVVSGVYLVPILLGAWIPVFTQIGMASQRTRFPFTVLLLVAWLLAANSCGHSNLVSRARQEPQPAMELGEAVAAWKQANCVDGTCPRPVLVTIAGGASRAAFFAATILGELIDNPCRQPGRACEKPDASVPLLAQRVFAISGVSGGSLGAIQAVAAMSDARRDPKSPALSPPCIDKSPAHFFKTPNESKWRDCLQVLAGEDFLSPTVLALVTSEPFLFLEPMLGRFWPNGHFLDRAAILENSWINHYQDNVIAAAKGAQTLPARGDLAQSFSRFGQSARKDGNWLPLLVLNATSEETGKRVLASQLANQLEPAAQIKLDRPTLFVDAFEASRFLGELASPRPSCAIARGNGLDLTLASAALNSARFPIVSPAGRFADGCDVTLRVVDGGYFENDGATTTAEIADALKRFGLAPVVIHIANDPVDLIADPERDQRPPPRDDSLMPLLMAPVNTVLSTRAARGSYALATLAGVVGKDNVADFLVFGEPVAPTQDKFAVVDRLTGFEYVPPEIERPKCFERTSPTTELAAGAKAPAAGAPPPALPNRATVLKEVSMSWWLSKPVQEYLDRQTYHRRNCQSLLKARMWLNEPLSAPEQRTIAEQPTSAPVKMPDR